MSEGIWVVPPEWKVEGGGGGGTGGTVSWGDIENKPTEFKPRPHEHEIEDVVKLQELLDNKVDKVAGKQLSEEDFTTELKKKLLELPSDLTEGIVTSVNGRDGEVVLTNKDVGLENVLNIEQASKEDLQLLGEIVQELRNKVEDIPDLPDNYVESINGETGKVTIDKTTVGLGNLINERQATKEELLSSIEDIERLIDKNKKASEEYTKTYVDEELGKFSLEQDKLLNNKVDKVLGKELSTNDYTDEDSFKLKNLPEKNKIVQTVNNKTPILGNVDIDKDDIGLSNLENIHYASKADFDAHTNDGQLHLTSSEKSQIEHLEENLNKKVDAEEGKGLSSNDFTDEDKSKLDNIPTEIEGLVTTVNEIKPDENGNVQISKDNIGLENVLNVQQASKEEFDEVQLTVITNTESINSLKETTTTHTKNIAELEDKLENLDFPESPVLSVNGKTGNVVINKETVGLSNVLDKEQATKEDLEEFKETSGVALLELAKTLEGYTDKEVASEADRTNSKLMEKVDKELGKGLSSNDFTKEYKDKLDNIDSNKKYVQTVNGATPDVQGDVKVDKSSVGLSKLENKDYTPLDDFTSYKVSTEASMALKVDKVEGKQLSTNDYTTEDKNKLANLPSEIDTGVMTINNTSPDAKGNVDIDFVTSDTLKSHTENNEIHLNEDDRGQIAQISNKVDKEPNKQLSTNDFTDEYKTKIDTNSNEIEAIKESIGNMKGIIISSEEPEEKYEGLIWYEIDSVE